MVPSIDVKECDPSYDSTASIISIGNGVNDNHSVFQDGTCKAEQSILTNSLHPNNGFGRKMGISVDIINGAKTAPCSQEDIIIAGAGPVGLLLALRLAQQNIQTLVLEMNGNLNQAPRAIGYFGPTHHVFQEAGIYDKVAKDGMPSGGFCWRLPLVDDGSGGKLLGPIIAKNVMSKPDEKGEWPLGGYSIQLAQDKLSAILLEALEKTGKSKVLWNHKVSGLIQDARGVTVTAETSDGVSEYHGSYLVGADGGKSNVRKLLQIRLSGHSWPERFVATDIIRTTTDVTALPVHFTVDPLKWAVITPLERVVAGHRNLWRYSMAVSDPSIPDEEVMSPEYVDKLILDQLDGPRPSDHVVKRKSLYKMHQLIASTMTKGRCFLIGDAAHINNPIGGLGLTTGLLDADALSQTFNLVFNHGASTTLFKRFSAERRRVFQTVVHPISSANKLRLHQSDPLYVAENDWYLQALNRGDQKELQELHHPLTHAWRTSMKDFL